MKAKGVAITLAILSSLLSTNIYALTLEFKNTTSKTIIYNLYWIDNPYRPGRMNMAGGELLAGKSNIINCKYEPGEYAVIWFHAGEDLLMVFQFDISEEDGKLILSPEGMERFTNL